MKESPIEPGLLHAFRWLIAVQLGMIILLFLVIPFFANENHPESLKYSWIFPLCLAILWAYLSWPPVQRLMGRLFIPLPLAAITLGPVLGQYFMWRRSLDSNLLVTQYGAWQLVPVLFIPLVLIAWQYQTKGVVIFSVGVTILSLGLMAPVVQLVEPKYSPIIGFTFIQGLGYAMVGGIISILMRAQKKQNNELSDANRRLLNYASTLEQLTVSRERNRMARDLHDTLAHTLSAASVQLEAVRVLWDTDPTQAQKLLDQTLKTTREGLTETRRALQSLRASPLEDLGLCLAIRNLAETSSERAGFELTLDLPNHLDTLSNDVAQAVYRSAQETIENVVKHARARHVSVSLFSQNGRITLKVTDDGQGFDPKSADSEDRFGLRGLRERAAISGGRLEVVSLPGTGTTVIFSVECVS